MNKISISDKNNKFLIEKNFFYECIEIFDRLKIRTSFFSDKKNGYIEISYRNLNDYVNECLFKIISNTIFFNNSVVYNDIKYRNDLDNEFTLLKDLIKFISDQINLNSNMLIENIYELYSYILEIESENSEIIHHSNYDRLRIYIDQFTDVLISQDIKFYMEYVEKIFNFSINIYEKQVEIAKLKEFYDYKNQMIENLKKFCSEEQIQNFIDNYNELLSLNPIDIIKLENFCNQYNEKIKNEYKKTMSDVNSYKSGMPFNFICHSIDDVDFHGDFKTRFVSCSYINEENYGLYRCNFGFIFDPKDIVWASDSDSYIINHAQNISNISRSTYLSLFMHPKLVMENNKKLKKQNKEMGIDKKIYNEIVIDGFNPIGIFCLSNGSKELNSDYCCALKLKEHFPHLPIVDIDLTMYKDYDRKIEKRNLVYALNSVFNHDYLSNELILDKYDIFFDKFLEMKKNGEFEIEKLKQLYILYTNELLNNNIINCQSFNESLDNSISKKSNIK